LNESFTYKAWRRLRKIKTAVAGMVIIILSLLTAIFAYFLAPDFSPDANRQVVEIGRKNPGYRQKFLLLPDGRMEQQTGFFKRLVSGVPDRYKYIPIQDFYTTADSVFAQKYVDEGLTQTIGFPQKLFTRNLNYYIHHKTYLLGTDTYGRDILSRLIVGVRVSVGVGLIAVFISLTIGILLGALAGYYRGATDKIIMWLMNVIWSIPTLLLVFAFTIALGKGFWQVFVAVGLTMWVNVARLVRGQVLRERELQYVEAARAMGFSGSRIMFRHILPNILGPVIVVAASNFASAIIIEAGLSFLGIGVQQPTPSWGLMIRENYNFIITNKPMLALVPGFAIMLLVMAFYLLGNGLRDALNVKARVT
jgi:ABC-type dipeptide/oligopeptide/nickel transport system permease subunit